MHLWFSTFVVGENLDSQQPPSERAGQWLSEYSDENETSLKCPAGVQPSCDSHNTDMEAHSQYRRQQVEERMREYVAGPPWTMGS